MDNNNNKRQDIEIARLQEQLKSANMAKSVADKEMERRLDSMNEIREQLNRQADTFVTKDELVALEVRLSGEIKLNRARNEYVFWTLFLGTAVIIALNYFK